MTRPDRIVFTGSNARAVKTWITDVGGMHGDFITRAASASTSGQAWRYVTANAATGTDWPTTVRAAIITDTGWLPVPDGATIVALDGADEDRDYAVLPQTPAAPATGLSGSTNTTKG